MSQKIDAVLHVVCENGGTLKGKTRLQKSVYFLEAMDVGFGFDFQYYHYGPYSEELAEAVDDAVELAKVSVSWGQGSYPFAIYEAADTKEEIDENALERQRILKILSSYNPVALELAATADYLKNSGFGENAWAETKIRKSAKASLDNVAAAELLLKELKRA